MNLLPSWLRRIGGLNNIAQPLVLGGTVLIVSLLLSQVISQLVTPTEYRQGDVAGFTIRAPRDFLLEDTLNTEKRRVQAASEAPRVFSFNDQSSTEVGSQLDSIFAVLKEYNNSGSGENNRKIVVGSREKIAFERKFQINLEGVEWDILLDSQNWVPMAEAVRKLVVPVLERGVLESKKDLSRILSNQGRAVIRLQSSGVEREIASIDSLFSYSQVEDIIGKASLKSKPSSAKAFRSVVRKISLSLIKPNMDLDEAVTAESIQAARDSVEPIYHRVRQGEVIVRQGDVVNASQERLLQRLREEFGAGSGLANWVGYLLLSAIVIISSFYFTTFFWPEVRRHTRDVALTCSILIGSLIVLKVFYLISKSLGDALSYIDSETFLLAAPLAAGGVLLQVTVGAPAVLMLTLSLALLTGLFLQNSWLLLLLIVVGNCVGAFSVRQCSRRSAFIAAGARIALANMFIVCCFLLLHSDYSAAENAGRILWALVGGFTSGVFAGGVAPMVEFFGGYITDIKLLELASLDRPLLRDLSVQAPGTWNHSMVIGQMGEAAADAIGANGLLVRVGAYYHDIGKMRKPAYFVENQQGENRHDKLTPSMSALIIKAHVKDGLEMAREHKLPEPILELIPQHHGTSLISYFYTKALKEADPDSVVDDTHYRYPGPKPQSKEAGILMLADAVEASSRTLSDPTPAKLQGLVQKIMNRVFASGELEECDLTLRDLHKIAKTFTRVLTGIYHRRVEYAESAEKTKEVKVPTVKANTIESNTATQKIKIKKDEPVKEQSEPRAETDDGDRSNDEGTAPRAAQESGAQPTDKEDSEEALKRLGIS